MHASSGFPVVGGEHETVKHHWKKMAEIPQECDFHTWSIQNFVRKVKQLVVRKFVSVSGNISTGSPLRFVIL